MTLYVTLYYMLIRKIEILSKIIYRSHNSRCALL